MIPRNEEREAGRAMDFIFLFFVRIASARAAAPCATLAAVAMGIQVFTPVPDRSPASRALYIWWTPATTVGA